MATNKVLIIIALLEFSTTVFSILAFFFMYTYGLERWLSDEDHLICSLEDYSFDSRTNIRGTSPQAPVTGDRRGKKQEDVHWPHSSRGIWLHSN